MSKGTEISVGRGLIEYFTPLTLGEKHQGTLSDEDVTEVWLIAKSETTSKVRRTKVPEGRGERDIWRSLLSHCQYLKHRANNW